MDPPDRAVFLDLGCGDRFIMPVTLEQFITRLTQSGLLTAEELSAFREGVPPEKRPQDAQGLARELIRARRLTKFQAEAVYRGRVKGLVMGNYVVLDKIGAGGMGEVLKARHGRMDRIVALKVLPRKAMQSEDAVKRFYREVKAAARLNHPNIVQAHDADECDGIHYLVMEFVDGQDLAHLVKQHGPLSVDEAVDCTLQTARGLAYAHGESVIHRDIKPGNLLLDKSGTVKVLDMGLARVTLDTGDEPERLTNSGQVMGTCDYMAPEQAEDTHTADHRADIYALGCTLYRLLTGKPPYQGDSLIKILLAHREAPVPSLRDVRLDVPEPLDAVYQKMLAKRPEDRYQSMGEVIEALEVCCKPQEAGMASRAEGSSDSALTSFLDRLAEPGSAKPASTTPPKAEETMPSQVLDDTGTSVKRPVARPGKPQKPTKPARPPRSPEKKRELVRNAWIAGGAALSLVLLGLLIVVLRGGNEDPTGAGQGMAVLEPGQNGSKSPPLAKAPFTAQQARWYQQQWAKQLGLPVEWDIELPGGVKLAMVLIPPGEFMMGSTETERQAALAEAEADDDESMIERIPTEGPRHRVKITRPFYLGKYEVTQAQWEALMDSNPSKYQGPANPVEQVSWNEIQPFLEKLNVAGTFRVPSAKAPHVPPNVKFVLPTEAQWEYACRAGTTTAFSFGDSAAMLGEYGWFHNNSGSKTHPVGGRKPNAWGLHDIHGNVWEWCADWSDSEYYANSATNDPAGPSGGSRHALRGGGWINDTWYCRSASRGANWPSIRMTRHGFRTACEIPSSPAGLAKFAAAIKASKPEKPEPPLAIAPFDAAKAKQHKQAWADHLGLPVEWTNSVGMQFVLIPPGEFMMGSTEEEVTEVAKLCSSANDAARLQTEQPRHRHPVPRPFYLGKHEVTWHAFRQYADTDGHVTQAERDSSGSGFDEHGALRFGGDFSWRKTGFDQREDGPVVNVTWSDALAFCRWLSEKEGREFRLPTESQWEYACRAGSTGHYGAGDDVAVLKRLANVADRSCAAKGVSNKSGQAFPWDDGYAFTAPVGQFEPNPFGLHDMLGNVFEICEDAYDPQAYDRYAEDNFSLPSEADRHVVRGGNWRDGDAAHFRCARRYYVDELGFTNFGFRVACQIPTDPAELAKFAAAIKAAKPEPQPPVQLVPKPGTPGKDDSTALTSDWLSLDIEACCSADVITTESHKAADPFTFNGGTVASAGWVRKHGYSEQGLPADGRVAIPGTAPPGFFQVQMPPANNAMLVTGPDGVQPKPITVDLKDAERRAYAELAILYCTCWGTGTLRVTLRYETGQEDTAVIPAVDWSPQGRTDPLPKSLHTAVTTRDTHPQYGKTGEMLAQTIPADPQRPLRSLTFAFDSLTATKAASEKDARRRFTVGIFAISARSADEMVTLANGWRVGRPVNLGAVVNGSENDAGPAISADGRQLYFHSQRPGGQGSYDIWVCDRESTSHRFNEPRNLGPPVNQGSSDTNPCISADGQTLLFTSRRHDAGTPDILMSKRTNGGDWGEPVPLRFGSDAATGYHNPFLSADGLSLLFAADPPGGQENPDLWMSRRKARSEEFGTPVNLGRNVNSDFSDNAPCLSTDGLALFFISARPGGQTDGDLWMCMRTSANAPFGKPVNLGPTVNSASADGQAALSTDGSTLYFASDRPGGQGKHDLWTVPVEPPAKPKGEHGPPPAVAPFDADQATKHQQACADYLGLPVEWTNSVGMQFVLIPPGEFMMGSGETEIQDAIQHRWHERVSERVATERPEHRFTIARPFYLGSREVTAGQFGRFVEATAHVTDLEKGGAAATGFTVLAKKGQRTPNDSWRDPGFPQSDDHPVVQVTWNDTAAFCKWLSGHEKAAYRLPAEAEWEYACRAGTTTPWSCGNDPATLRATANVADASYKRAAPKSDVFPWDDGNAYASPVGRFQPNAFGLFDMHGNVWEWCRDWYAPDAYERYSRGDPSPPASGTDRVQRGACWIDSIPVMFRSAYREHRPPNFCTNAIGFRVVCEIPTDPAKLTKFATAVKAAEPNPKAESGKQKPPAE